MRLKLKYTKLLRCVIIFILFTACNSSDDNNIDPAQLVSNYQEPNLNLGILIEDFLLEEGDPDEQIGISLRYYLPQNGIERFTYIFFEDAFTGDIFLGQINVQVYNNQQNLNYMLGFLTDKYGETELQSFGVNNGSGYEWNVDNQGQNMRIQLVLDGDDGDGLFLIDYSIF